MQMLHNNNNKNSNSNANIKNNLAKTEHEHNKTMQKRWWVMVTPFIQIEQHKM